jgi:hypothetical protein
MIEWWSEIEQGIIVPRKRWTLSPGELGHRVGISEGEAIAFLCMLARERKVSIRLVGLHAEPANQAARAVACLGEEAGAARHTAGARGD